MAELGSLAPEEWAFWDRWMRAQRLLNRAFDQDLQQALGISKADFGVLITLDAAPDGRMRVSELAIALDWDKGRVAHQLTRMERRGLLERIEAGAAGRRTGVGLTASGRTTARDAIRRHSSNIRRLVLDQLTDDERERIAAWSARVVASA